MCFSQNELCIRNKLLNRSWYENENVLCGGLFKKNDETKCVCCAHQLSVLNEMSFTQQKKQTFTLSHDVNVLNV